ncbi:hypothetical protein BT93_C2593 [Corymbia citriodora subsp. variegata]|nr:hypothetical protein BT93_C2593 [Corymbia citriodora subsp. variegata]
MWFYCVCLGKFCSRNSTGAWGQHYSFHSPSHVPERTQQLLCHLAFRTTINFCDSTIFLQLELKRSFSSYSFTMESNLNLDHLGLQVIPKSSQTCIMKTLFCEYTVKQAERLASSKQEIISLFHV